MITKTSPSGDSLFGRAREAVIGILYGAPGVRLHVREIARQAGLSAPTIARELANLKRIGALKAEAVGNQLIFSADEGYPLAAELRSIAMKTWGVIFRLRAALGNRTDIEVAFVFGSFATGAAGPASDIDVLVISDAPYAGYAELSAALSDELKRTVSLKLYRRREWLKKRAEGNAFVTGVGEGPKIFLLGDEGALNGRGSPAGHVGERVDPGTPGDKSRGRGAPARRARVPRGR